MIDKNTNLLFSLLLSTFLINIKNKKMKKSENVRKKKRKSIKKGGEIYSYQTAKKKKYTQKQKVKVK